MSGDTPTRPLCKCHGEPMHRKLKYWRCAVKSREDNRKRAAARAATRAATSHPKPHRFYENDCGVMFCVCHKEPALVIKHSVGGSSLTCRIKKRESDKRYRLAHIERERMDDRIRARKRYDTDPIYRIGKNLKRTARQRRQTIERRRAELDG